MMKAIATISAPSEAFNLAEELWSAMQNGVAPWQKTWKTGQAISRPMNVSSGHYYRSGNSLYLMAKSAQQGWSNQWISYVECAKLGGSLKGEKGTRIEVPLIRTEINSDTGEDKEVLRGFRTCTVFNIDQVKDVSFEVTIKANPIESIASIDGMLEALKLQGLSYEEPSANGGCWYLPAQDKVGMPLRTNFNDTYEFYSSLCHELGHATMRPGRVDRPAVSYAYEELRAEIASTLICATLNLPRSQSQIDNHAAYLKDWLNEFTEQKQVLLRAASEAQAIHDYLMKLSSH